MKLKYKLFLFFSFIVLGATFAEGILFYTSGKNSIQLNLNERLVLLKNLKKRQINLKLSTFVEGSYAFANKHELRQAFNSYKNTSNSVFVVQTLTKLVPQQFSDESDLEQVLFLDKNLKKLYSSQTIVNEHLSELLPMHTSFVEQNKVHIFATLVGDKPKIISVFGVPGLATDTGSTTLGYLVFVYDTNSLFADTRNYVGFGKTGESFLIYKEHTGHDNNSITYLSSLRFNYDVMGKPVIETNVFSADLFKDTDRHFLKYKDYRNQNVEAVTVKLDLADIVLVTKIDTTEGFAGLEEFKRQVLVLVAIIFFISALFSFVVSEMLVAPITALTLATKKVADGNLNQEIKISSSDELGTLAKSFNTMAKYLSMTYNILEKQVAERTKELTEARATLEKSNISLEEAVKQRTTELEKLKTGLETQVKFRTAELNNKVAELEKMNKFMVDRELKLVELKNENENLRKKLGLVKEPMSKN